MRYSIISTWVATRGRAFSALALCAALALGSPAPMSAAGRDGTTLLYGGAVNRIRTQLVVRFEPGVRSSDAERKIGATGGSVAKTLPATRLVSYAVESSAATALRKLNADPDVRYAFYNQTFSLPTVRPAPSLSEVARSGEAGTGAAGSRTQSGTTPADGRRIAAGGSSLRGYQWYLDRIGDDLTRPPRKDAPVVAVIDTGVDATHPDLAGQVVRCPAIPGLYCDAVDHDQTPMDTVGHGTHVASTIAADADGSGIRGVSPTSTVLPVRIFDDRGRTDLMTIFQALDYVIQAKDRIPSLRVANMSFGGVLVKGSAEHQEYNTRLAALRDAGVLAVAAAGNDSDLYLQGVPLIEGIEVVDMPAMGPGVLAVAATDQTDYRTYFSNYSTPIRINSCATYYEEDGYKQCAADNRYTTRTLRHVPVAAPGWQVLAATLRGQHIEMAGTSMASPIVAGAAARVMSAYPRLTNSEVRQRIIRTGVPLGTGKGFPFTTRRLDLRRALDVRATGFTGRVMDGVGGTPIGGATVTLSSGGRVVDTARTDASGFYTLRGAAPGGSYTLGASRTNGPAYISNSRRAVAADDQLRAPSDLSLAPLRTDGSYTFMAEWRNVATGIEEYRKESFADYRADRPYPWPVRAAGMPLVNIDPIFGVPYPGEPSDSVEFDRYNPGSLSGFPYGRHTSTGYVDLDAHAGTVIGRLPATGSLRYGVRWIAPGGFAKSGAAVSLYRNGRLLHRSALAKADAPADGTRGMGTSDLTPGTWGLYDIGSRGGVRFPTANPNGRRSEYAGWTHRNNDLPGVRGPAAGGARGGELDNRWETPGHYFGWCVADCVDFHNVRLEAGKRYSFVLDGHDASDVWMNLLGPETVNPRIDPPYLEMAIEQVDATTRRYTYAVPAGEGGRHFIVVWREKEGTSRYTLSRP